MRNALESIPASGNRPEIQLPSGELWIGGERRQARGGGATVVVDPARDETIMEVAAGGADDVDAAVKAARVQFDEGPWSRLTGVERGRLLFRLADLLERDGEYFRLLETLDVGQPSLGAAPAVDALRYYAGWADKIDGRQVPMTAPSGAPVHAYTRREPVGVVAAITPWNAPLMIAAWKLGPALAAGCTVVIKPPEDAPLSTLHLAALIEEAEFPAGAVNMVTGLGEVAGAALARHPQIDKISFTGSPEVGREVAKVAANGFKRVTLELGGKSPQLIFADADLERAIPLAALSFYANSGQVCAAGTRILVQSEVADAVVAALASEAAGVRVGDPFSPDTHIGALINKSQLERVMGYIQAGVDEGAELVSGGDRPNHPGYFVNPTLFKGSNDLTIAQREIFGPVATVTPFADVDDAVRLANATDYGLSAHVWTQDVTKAHSVAARLRSGTVRVNCAIGVDARLPWGGVKTSGVGRELGFSGIEACTEEKAVVVELS